jgi:hypothetical protein
VQIKSDSDNGKIKISSKMYGYLLEINTSILEKDRAMTIDNFKNIEGQGKNKLKTESRITQLLKKHAFKNKS